MTRPPRRQSKLADEHPAYPPPVAVPEPPPHPEGTTQARAALEQPAPSAGAAPASASATMPPPRRRRQTREQLNTRIATDLHARLQRFVTDHDAAVQDVVETALTEYLDLRGG